MNVAIIYHSEGGNTKAVAEIVALGAGEVEGTNVKIMSLEEIDAGFVRGSDAVLFGCPTYCGSFSWQMKKFFDTTDLDLEGKLGAVFATENVIGGGADLAELGMIGMMLVRGMLAYSAGFTRSGAITHFGAVTIRSGDEPQRERARLLGWRVAEKARRLFVSGVPAVAGK